MTKNTPASTLTFDDLSDYQQMIVEDVGCALEDAYKIEDIMRNDVFHSTLDWQSRAEFRRGARKAFKMYQKDRAGYEEMFATFREATEKFFAESENQNQQGQTTA
jgi:hypothetical protein